MPSPAASRPHTRRRFVIAALLPVVILAGIIGIGSIRTATLDATGTQLDGYHSTSTLPNVIRIGSFNIHGGQTPEGNANLPLVADIIKDLDFVGLQEVRDTPWPGTPPQAKTIADALLGHGWLYAPSERQYFSARFGNGVVTDLPLDSWERIALPSGAEGSRRNLLIYRSDGREGAKLTLMVTHIARHEDQDAQLRFVADRFLAADTPVVLMGDMNATSDHPQIARLLNTPGVLNPIDEKMPEIRGQHIDWILARGLKVRDAGVRDLGASDHPMVWAELSFPTPSTQPQ